jgi:RNA polymerase sigma factor (sigma-70 family)
MSLATMGRYLGFLAGRSDSPLPDGRLLERYVATRDESAFAALVERYGSLVLGVCERVLQHAQDAEDAFQATFLVLARRAATLDGRRPLGNWLYAVAYRTAVKARQSAARRRARELQVLDMATVPASEEEKWSDLRPLLDEELNQLPEKYRAPLLLCFLEGKTHQQAARELGWPSGSMSRRMNRARELLRKRLARRGVALSTGFLFMLIAENAGAATVSPALVGVTTKAALLFGAGEASAEAAVSTQVAQLAADILRTTTAATTAKTGSLLITLALLGLIGTTTAVLTHQVRTLLQGAGWGCANPAKPDATK